MDIEQRLLRVERTNRILLTLLVGGAFAAAVLSFATAGGEVPMAQETKRAVKEVAAERFVLVDEEGKVRIEIGFIDNERPGIYFYDKEGRNRSVYQEGTDGNVTLSTRASKGDNTGAVVGWDELGHPAFFLQDKNDNSRVYMYLDDRGRPSLTLSDEVEQPRAKLEMIANGSVELGLADEDGQIRAELTFDPDGGPMLILSDENGRPIRVLP